MGDWGRNLLGFLSMLRGELSWRRAETSWRIRQARRVGRAIQLVKLLSRFPRINRHSRPIPTRSPLRSPSSRPPTPPSRRRRTRCSPPFLGLLLLRRQVQIPRDGRMVEYMSGTETPALAAGVADGLRAALAHVDGAPAALVADVALGHGDGGGLPVGVDARVWET